jgi:hypothetical protein
MQLFSTGLYNPTSFTEFEARNPIPETPASESLLAACQSAVTATARARLMITARFASHRRRNALFRPSLCGSSATVMVGYRNPRTPTGRTVRFRQHGSAQPHRSPACLSVRTPSHGDVLGKTRVPPWPWPCSGTRCMTFERRRTCVHAVLQAPFIPTVTLSLQLTRREIRSHAPGPSPEGHGGVS